ncbi:MAG: PQQ-binding-like beta-propeller repeat protein, partial [Planctomycetota bacterium]
DVPYGRMTTDGNLVFMIDDLGRVERTNMGMIRLGGVRPSDTRRNTLIALELATEGKLRWKIGAGENRSSAFSESFFLGPPLPLNGRLYVIVETAGDLHVCCLDPQTGDEIWRQQLAALETGGIQQDAIRRVAGAVPTYHEGVLICPTGAGAIVAVNLIDRSLRWGKNYPRSELFGPMTMHRSSRPASLLKRWHDGAAIASGSMVMVTPAESERLFNLDLLTGEDRARPSRREKMLYLAGIRGDRYFVVGSESLQAFDTSSGKAVWKTQSDLTHAGQLVAGRGVFGDGVYYLPLTDQEIVAVSLDDGSVIDRRETAFPLGNLVAVDGEVISQSATTLAVAYGEQSLRPRVDQALRENPSDFDALVRKSQLLIQEGDRDEALVLLGRARKLRGDDDEVHELSVNAMLGILREDLNADSDIVATLDELIDFPEQRAEFIGLRIRAALAQSDVEAATEQLIQLTRLAVEEMLQPGIAEQIVGPANHSCTLEAWLAARVADTLAIAQTQNDSSEWVDDRFANAFLDLEEA